MYHGLMIRLERWSEVALRCDIAGGFRTSVIVGGWMGLVSE